MVNLCACFRPSEQVVSPPMGGLAMVETTERGEGSSAAEKIKRSERHWSERVESDCSPEEEAADNRAVFQALQLHPTWGAFFKTFGYDLGIGYGSAGELEVGAKFAEGAQAELFHAHVTWNRPEMNEWDLRRGNEWVLKVMKKGTLLRHLQSQWPLGFLKHRADIIERTKLDLPQETTYSCDIQCGTLLKDGRFAFLMPRLHEDLRALIERNMLSIWEDHGPFSKDMAEMIMYLVAEGMKWLHNRNIVHRDLKASNILFRKDMDGWVCFVADFECSIGVVGTGFWRAPEILQALKNKVVNEKSKVFSKEADVYSYGMTCYEILTGKLPFEGHLQSDYNLVLKEGQRPEVPNYVDDWIQELLSRCWQEDPASRPSFREIMNIFSANSAQVREYQLRVQQGEEEDLKEEDLRKSLLLEDPMMQFE